MKLFLFIFLIGCAGPSVSTFDSISKTDVVDSFPSVKIKKGTYEYSGTTYVLKRTMKRVNVHSKTYKVKKYIMFEDSIYIYNKQ